MKPKRVHKIPTDSLFHGTASFAMQESFVRLRTNFIYATMNGEYQKIVFTSCQSGEGKSTTVLNLATSLARAGKQVLVMDCDLRRSVLTSYLREEGQVHAGMSEVLSCQADLYDVIYTVPEKGFDMIFAGAHAPNPSELISSDQMKEVLSQMEKCYEYILIDASPVLAVSDAVILGGLADGVIFVVQHQAVSKKQIRLALSEIRSKGTKILGTVLSQYDIRRDYSATVRGGYYYNYYQNNA